eukprot:TRINITY_DN66126_c0_g1_i1.p1 TRINITY_DN66126_c0_g1~~TRINITY_DN66126_c0_g1_i1.p1  ORF type:complete len:673 (-),score=102.88 TRINITY_DN66126_c0_g1_i1:1202-3199(-)
MSEDEYEVEDDYEFEGDASYEEDALAATTSNDYEVALDEEALLPERVDKGYQILTAGEVIDEQNKELEKIVSVCALSSAWARVLCRSVGWNTEKLLDSIFDKGHEAVLKENGIDVQSAFNISDNVECSTCFDDVPPSDAFGLSCGHIFCKDCWTTYITTKVKEGQSRDLRCMGFKCTLKVDDAVILNFVDDETKTKFTRALVESYIDDNDNVKWCPSTPHCGNCVRIYAVGKLEDIQCTCGHSFCFNCLNQVHTPATCLMASKWVAKCKDDSETANWMKVNTKPCPHCNQSIEKNGGCNYVMCTKCHRDFCWICMFVCPKGESHTAHDCNKYQKDEANSDSAKSSLERYLFYYDRWKSHDDSTKFESLLREQIIRKTQIMWNRAGSNTQGHTNVDLINEAMEVLFSCRHILRNSYVFAFYLFDETVTTSKSNFLPFVLKRRDLNRLQNLYEDNQQQLENATERLSWWLERPVEDYITKKETVRDAHAASVVALKRLEALFTTVGVDILGGDSGIIASLHKAKPSPYHINYTPEQLREIQRKLGHKILLANDTFDDERPPPGKDGKAAYPHRNFNDDEDDDGEEGKKKRPNKREREMQFHEDMQRAMKMSEEDNNEDAMLAAAIAASVKDTAGAGAGGGWGGANAAVMDDEDAAMAAAIAASLNQT